MGGAAALRRLARAGRTVDVEVDGEDVVFNVPLDEEGEELIADVVAFGEDPPGLTDGERGKQRVRRGLKLIGKWAPRLIEGADELSAADIEFVIRRMGYLRTLRAVQQCAGMRAPPNALSPDSA